MSFFLSKFACKFVQMTKLSIITINRNNAAGLRKTMDSVFAQTYRDFEYIIVDGASTDESVDVIREYESVNHLSIHPLLLTWISESDSGIYNAMNKGIVRAKGEYLLFLNSGDFLIAQDVLEQVFAFNPSADILCCRCNVSDGEKVVWTSNPPQQITFGFLYTAGLAHQSTFIKRALFETCGLYREEFKYNSDIAFWYNAIIDNHATTQTIDVITTDYNLAGISSRESKSEQYIRELSEIVSPYEKFTPDYDMYQKNQRILNQYLWLEECPLLKKILSYIYKIRKHL